MKKSILAIAVLGAFAGAAQAQSSVTVYGIADIGWKTTQDEGRVAGVGSVKSSGISDGAIAGSRIGFRGTEDLGGGLKANFVIEQGLALTNDESFATRVGTAGHQADFISGAQGSAYTNGTNRQSWVGLSGGFGEVRLGYQYTNLYSVASLSGYNLTSEGVRGADFAHLHGGAVVGGFRANGITYISPNFSGFQGTLQYGAASAGRETFEGYGITQNGTRWSARLNYAAGPLSADLVHTQSKQTTIIPAGTVTQNAFGVQTTSGAINGNTGERTGNLTQVSASYDFGVAKVSASYNNGKDGGTNASNVNSKYTAYQLNARVPVGAFALVGSYGQAKTRLDSTGADTYNEKGYQLGAQYSLSKRTMAYIYHGRSKDDGTASAASPLAEKKSTIVGMFHSF